MSMLFRSKNKQKNAPKKLSEINGGSGKPLCHFLDDYKIFYNRPLGKGAFANVYQGERRRDGLPVALKCIEVAEMSEREKKKIRREIRILEGVSHENIARLYDWYENEDRVVIAMEYIRGGMLHDCIVNEDRVFTERDVCRLMHKLLKAMKYCNERGIVHRDLKPQNLLLTEFGNKALIKIIDFNLSIEVDQETLSFSMLETMCGSQNYVAPEVLSRQPYSYKCDIWSLGVICFLLLSGGYLPFFTEFEGEEGRDDLLERVAQGIWDFQPAEAWESVSSTAKNFLRCMMRKNPDKRYDYNQLLSHNWFKTLHSSTPGSCEIRFDEFKKAANQEKMKSAYFTLLAANKFKKMMNTEEQEANPEIGKLKRLCDSQLHQSSLMMFDEA